MQLLDLNILKHTLSRELNMFFQVWVITKVIKYILSDECVNKSRLFILSTINQSGGSDVSVSSLSPVADLSMYTSLYTFSLGNRDTVILLKAATSHPVLSLELQPFASKVKDIPTAEQLLLVQLEGREDLGITMAVKELWHKHAMETYDKENHDKMMPR